MAVQSITLHSLHVIFTALTQIWRTAQELIEFLWDQLREEGIILVIKLWFQPCKAAFFPWCENKSCVHTENCKRGERAVLREADPVDSSLELSGFQNNYRQTYSNMFFLFLHELLDFFPCLSHMLSIQDCSQVTACKKLQKCCKIFIFILLFPSLPSHTDHCPSDHSTHKLDSQFLLAEVCFFPSLFHKSVCCSFTFVHSTHNKRDKMGRMLLPLNLWKIQNFCWASETMNGDIFFSGTH